MFREGSSMKGDVSRGFPDLPQDEKASAGGKTGRGRWQDAALGSKARGWMTLASARVSCAQYMRLLMRV